MVSRSRWIPVVAIVLALLASCGPAAPTTTPVPPTYASAPTTTPATPADTAVPATVAPTAMDTAATPLKPIPTPTPTKPPAATKIEVSGPQTLAGHSGAVTSLAFSPDGAVLASTGHDNTLHLWDVATGQVIRILQGGSASVKGLDFGPDGNLLATVEADQTIALWDLATGQILRRIGDAGIQACGLEFSPDGTLLASGHADMLVRLWDVQSGELLRTLRGMEGVSCPVAFSPDGALVASGGGNTDSRVLVWEVATGELRHTLSGHDPNVYRVVFSPDGTLLASASGDRTAKIWDVDSGRLLHSLDADKYKLMHVAFSSDSRLLVSGGDDGLVRLWDVASGQLLSTLRGHSREIYAVAFSPVDLLFASAGEGGDVLLWHISSPPHGGEGPIAFVSVRSGVYRIHLMNADGTGMQYLTQGSYPAWSPDGKRIAFSSEHRGSSQIFVKDLAAGDRPAQMLTDKGTNWEPAWAPDGTRIAFGSTRDGNPEIYVLAVPDGTDAAVGDPHRLTHHDAADGYPCWSPDSTQIAFVSNRDGNEEIYVINADGAEPASGNLRRLTNNEAEDWDPDWSPDGTRIAFVSNRDGDYGIYTMAPDGSDQRPLTEAQQGDWNPTWSPDGQRIVFASSRDGDLEIYVMVVPDGTTADGVNARKLTDDRFDNKMPAWRPAPAPPNETGYTPSFEPGDCQFDVPAGYEVECGDLVVPEDRGQPGGPTIRLHVGVFKSSSPDPEPDPVIHLIGGPGGSTLDAASFLLDTGGHEILKKRDYVMFSQRGTHYAVPFLGCPDLTAFRRELAGQNLSLDERYAQELDFWLDCQDSLLAQGIHLAAYNSAENAADVNDMRIALGYEQVNLYGISYGSRLALTVIRDHPEGISCAIIDAIWPPQVNLDHEVALSAHRAFSALFEACAVDAHCSQTYPDLETTFYQTIRELNANPVSLQVSHGTVIVDGYDLLESVFIMMYSINDIPWIPSIIAEASRGELNEALFEVPERKYYSHGMHYSVRCHEELAFESRDEALALAASIPSELKDFFADAYEYALCASWQAGTVDPLENEAVVSDIPILVLSGHYDPITPPAYGRLAAETLSNSYFYEFATLSHGVMRSNECALAMGLRFLDDPTTEPDTSCIEQLTGPDFR